MVGAGSLSWPSLTKGFQSALHNDVKYPHGTRRENHGVRHSPRANFHAQRFWASRGKSNVGCHAFDEVPAARASACISARALFESKPSSTPLRRCYPVNEILEDLPAVRPGVLVAPALPSMIDSSV
jgi:hypothetical protein